MGSGGLGGIIGSVISVAGSFLTGSAHRKGRHFEVPKIEPPAPPATETRRETGANVRVGADNVDERLSGRSGRKTKGKKLSGFSSLGGGGGGLRF